MVGRGGEDGGERGERWKVVMIIKTTTALWNDFNTVRPTTYSYLYIYDDLIQVNDFHDWSVIMSV